MESKFKLVLPLLLGSVLLSACIDTTDESIDDAASVKIGNVAGTNKSNPVVPTKRQMSDVSVSHVVKYNDKDIKLNTTYSIDKRRLNDWRFTYPTSIKLNISTEDKDNTILVSNVYADVSVISHKARYNGVRQDSMNLDMTTLPSGGTDISPDNDYESMFKVEGINNNQLSVVTVNGTGGGGTDRITESQLNYDAEGALLNVVWTILVKDDDGKLFTKTVEDTVGLPVKEKDHNGTK